MPKEIHEHVASCVDCQSDINRLRELLAGAGKKQNNNQSRRDKAVIELLRLHFAWAGRPVKCTEVKPFLPSLADPLLRIRQQTPITAHVENCHACSEELSALIESGLTHVQLCRLSRIIAGDLDADSESPGLRAPIPLAKRIMKRPDSGAATLFTLGKPDDKDETDISYAFPPFKVELIGTDAGPSRFGQKASALKLKRYLKPMLAAAAVMLICFAMFFRAPVVKAVVGPEQIYTAIKGADNIHILHFLLGSTEAMQEMWISRSRGIYMTKTGQELALWDITNGLKKKKETFDDRTELLKLTKNSTATIKEEMNGTLGITPFSNISDIPPDAKWKQVNDIDFEPEFQDCEVYDFTWSADDHVLNRWRYFVEPATSLPRRAKHYRQHSVDKEYILYRDIVVEYLDEKEIEAAIQKASF